MYSHNNKPLKSFILKPAVSILLLMLSTYALATRNHTDHPLHQLEISGISIATPSDKIADILIDQGYTQAGFTRFTKQEQLQNQRKTLFRIEVEDTPTSRTITYHRSLSGGRVKTTKGEQPVPDFELNMARQLYQIICENVTDEINEERLCEPFKPSNISANYGQFINIDDQFAVQLSATASNTAIGIKYIYE